MDKQKSIETLQFFVTGLSNGAFRHEVQSRIFKSQGYNSLAEKFDTHSKEEYEWVNKFIDRIVDLGGSVKVEDRPAQDIVTDPIVFMNVELKIQREGLEVLRKCMETVAEDVTTYDLLKDYFKDEEQDLYDDENELELLKMLGNANWLMTKL